ncbi:VRR-NUC domain-containing protein [Virgibacillus sp. C22-A2]|uniref:VRR-NUC domain-containing protein n=1 Tax=Virgibacillus tibetensis TaxID=3042313 RepID=A0ABU6KAK5_9BACI|nr:VRR-NUC domain-containing protein [Virgibacillus sp. C22-A2]
MNQTEKAIEDQIKRYLDSIGAWHMKVHGSMYQKAGIPDLIGVVNSSFVGIEVKKIGGRVSALQTANIKLINQAGGHAFVAYSVNDVKQEFRERGIT